MSDLFPGFTARRVRTAGAVIHTVRAGHGMPLLLLHGYPQTHAMWHALAPALAREHAVVCADLRGYGDSSKRGADFSKRAMAADMAEVMQRLGHERFHVIGHDRGARVAHRLARDHAERVASVTVIDICPTLAMYERTDMAFARAYWHWFFFIQPAPLPERLLAHIGFDGMLALLTKATAGRGGFDKRAIAEYKRCFTPAAIHAMCEDYRASAGIDLDHDREDGPTPEAASPLPLEGAPPAGRQSRTRGGRATHARDAAPATDRMLRMPLLAIWGTRGVVGTQFDCEAEWRKVARDVRGVALDCGHFVPEERPRETLAAIRTFLKNVA
jgi:haloacetate dehalogenase